jgi:hypothetical protein
MDKSNLIPFTRQNLEILFIGLNPAKGSSDNRHYFSVNQAFWNQLNDAGLITERVNKLVADNIVFGGNDINYRGWSYGITDLITEVAESDSGKIKPTVEDCRRLEREIRKYKPRTAILLHGKVTNTFLPYFGIKPVRANHGQIGKILENCHTMFYSIAFPHGNNIPTKEKVEKYRAVKNYLLKLL